jgi:phosphohistidine phosphatase
MQLYLLRHADADTPAASDFERALSPKGHEQAERVGRFCRANDVRHSTILHSPLKRARETAQHVAEATGAPLEMTQWLASGMAPHAGIEELKAYRAQPAVMLVGHEPDFSLLITLLMGLPSNVQLHVRKASLFALELDVFRPGAARLEWCLPVRLM